MNSNIVRYQNECSNKKENKEGFDSLSTNSSYNNLKSTSLISSPKINRLRNKFIPFKNSSQISELNIITNNNVNIKTHSNKNDLPFIKKKKRKDVFGHVIKKGGNQRVSFIDKTTNKNTFKTISKDYTKNSHNYLVDIIEVESYKECNKINSYKVPKDALTESKCCTNVCNIY